MIRSPRLITDIPRPLLIIRNTALCIVLTILLWQQKSASKEDQEFDELAMDNYSQQGKNTDGSDNSADKDYSGNTNVHIYPLVGKARLVLSTSLTFEAKIIARPDP